MHVIKRFFLTLLIAGTSLLVFGQDIHFTQFNMSPLTINPALTGGFYGSFRIGGLYRDQWVGTYKTPSFYIDSPILKGFRDQDWVGVGMMFYQDQGISEYNLNNKSRRGKIIQGGALASIAYHLALDKKRKTTLSAGIQGGTLSRRLADQFIFEDEILNGQTEENIDTDKNSAKSILDISGGLTVTGKTVGESYYRIGFSIFHINQPDYSIGRSSTQGVPPDPNNPPVTSRGSKARLPMKMVGFARYDYDINDKVRVMPSVLFQSIGPASEFAVQAMAGYKMPVENLMVSAGLGYRIGDALEVLGGIEYKDLRVGISYDLTLSDLVSPYGAFELAVAYIGKIHKRPKVDPVIFCPRF
jgi:type IX secretion system PorP/SprF family membrane protein